jgi:diguanylate cyclase (GGDEF)-like protein
MEVLRRDWSIAQRDGRTLTVMHIDVDGCRDYLEVFGRSATDNMLRQVGRTIASAMRRTSDIVARLANDEFLLLGVSMEEDRAREHAEHIAGRIRALAIHHPRSRTGRYLTVSVGVVTSVPPRDRGSEVLIEAAQRALVTAKERGGNTVVAGSIT